MPKKQNNEAIAAVLIGSMAIGGAIGSYLTSRLGDQMLIAVFMPVGICCGIMIGGVIGYIVIAR